MTGERDFISALRKIATHRAARGLADDAAVLTVAAGELVLTHDVLAEGVHYLAGGDPADVAWKLAAVNLSDLAAKGATPLGALLGFALGDSDWDSGFAAALGDVLARYDMPLLGGDTVRLPKDAPRVIGMTAIGTAPVGGAPSRDGARPGDRLWITGTIGDAGAGLEICHTDGGDDELVAAYLRPQPRLAEGQALAPHVSAMMDVSDGLLIDAGRMGAASGLAIEIALDAVPLSPALVRYAGDNKDSRMTAATAGDDYELLFALPANVEPPVAATAIGRFSQWGGLSLAWHGEPVDLPSQLGFSH